MAFGALLQVFVNEIKSSIGSIREIEEGRFSAGPQYAYIFYANLFFAFCRESLDTNYV